MCNILVNILVIKQQLDLKHQNSLIFLAFLVFVTYYIVFTIKH
jgi:hypothetical protein